MDNFPDLYLFLVQKPAINLDWVQANLLLANALMPTHVSLAQQQKTKRNKRMKLQLLTMFQKQLLSIHKYTNSYKPGC